jgi:peptidyl-prolyl cis-trans isomerase C
MRASRLVGTALLLIVWAASGCGKDRDASPALAMINGKAVTQADFDAYLKLKRIPAVDAERLKKVLDEYAEREGLAAQIESTGKMDGPLVAAELNEFRKEMLISRYFDQLLDGQVNDQAIQAYYDTHAAEFEEKKVHVAHILFRTHARMAPEERQAKLTSAREAHSKASTGTPFAEVASAMSEDRVSAEKGGDLGWVGQGGVDAQFSEKVFAMKADELSEPFESGFGYHVVKVLDPVQTVRKPFAAVQGDIRYKLRAEGKNAEMKRLLDKVKVEHKAAPKLGSKDKTDKKPGDAR